MTSHSSSSPLKVRTRDRRIVRRLPQPGRERAEADEQGKAAMRERKHHEDYGLQKQTSDHDEAQKAC